MPILDEDVRQRLYGSYIEVLKDARSKQNLSQTKLAKSTGLSTKYVTLIESGRRLPSLECLFALMAEAGVFRDTALELAGKILDQFNWKG